MDASVVEAGRFWAHTKVLKSGISRGQHSIYLFIFVNKIVCQQSTVMVKNRTVDFEKAT
jgi:hypothetical protein